MNVLVLALLLAAPFEEHHIIQEKPSGQNDRAVLKGAPPWCKGKFEGEQGWSEGRLYRAISSSGSNMWVQAAIQLCEHPEDPTWQKNAQALIQKWINATGSSQAAAEEAIAKGIVASQKDKANEGKEPSDEERLGYPERDLTPIEPDAGVETVKPGKMSWCDVVKPTERWAPDRIRRTVEAQYGIQGVIDGAVHICQRPDDVSWQKEGAFILQKWMNWTHQSKADAEKSIAARGQTEKFKAGHDALCKAIEVSGEASGGDKIFGEARRRLLGCENDNQPLWQDTSGSWDDVGYYFDPTTQPPDEIVRMAHLFRATEKPRADLPSKDPAENSGLILYAANARDFELTDAAAVDKAMSAAPYNEYARVVANETVAYLKARQKSYEAIIEKMAKSDADYMDILRKAPKKGWDSWDKLNAQWKTEIGRSNAFEQKLFGPSRKALKGCFAELNPDVQKLIKSYKLSEYSELRDRISGDAVAMLLMGRLSLCAAFEKIYGLPGVLKDLVHNGRELRGPRSMAWFAILDALSEAQKDRPKIALKMPGFAIGGQSLDGYMSEFGITGGIPTDIERSAPHGVVGSVTKVPEGLEVKFQKTKITYPEAICHDDKSHPLKIERDGTIRYYQICKYTGKMLTEDTTPRPIVISPQLGANVKAGVYAIGQEYSERTKSGTFMGMVHMTKSNAKEKKIQTFHGYDL